MNKGSACARGLVARKAAKGKSRGCGQEVTAKLRLEGRGATHVILAQGTAHADTSRP